MSGKRTPAKSEIEQVVAAELKAWRENATGLGPDAFAKLAGLPRTTVLEMERGRRLTLRNVARFCGGVGVSLSEFFATVDDSR